MGTEACGKTILLAVLSHRYRAFTEEGYFLEAMNAEAHAFTNRNWELLASQGEWPPATPPGALHGFVWRLHRRAPIPTGTGQSATESLIDLTMADFAGEVFRKCFGKGDTSSAEADQLMSFVRQTDGIVCLVNLRDIVDEQDVERKSETEWAIKNLIDHASKGMGIPVLLAFTQADRYEALLEGRDSRAVLHEYMPQVAGAHPDVQVLFIAAVDRTTLATGDDGLVIEKPGKDFGSRGVSELLEWISKVRARPQPPVLPVGTPVPTPPMASQVGWVGSRRNMLLGLIASIPVAFWVLWPSSPPPPPQIPIIPVQFGERQSSVAESKVAQVKNLSERPLDVVCTVVRPPRESELYRKVHTIAPGQFIEIGWMEGHGFSAGDRLKVHAEGYRDSYADFK
jgi:hypothetical protein